MNKPTDTEILNWLEIQATNSPTGISIDKVPTTDNERGGFRFMRRFYISYPEDTMRDVLINAMKGVSH